MNELLPCRFCGNAPYNHNSKSTGAVGYHFFCGTGSCPAHPYVTGETRELTIEYWNAMNFKGPL